MIIFLKILDGTGLYGSLIQDTFSFSCFLSALLIFIYLWRKGKLDMDQTAANEMLEIDEE